jgi:long-chain acyl-CoA synthetase
VGIEYKLADLPDMGYGR